MTASIVAAVTSGPKQGGVLRRTSHLGERRFLPPRPSRRCRPLPGGLAPMPSPTTASRGPRRGDHPQTDQLPHVGIGRHGRRAGRPAANSAPALDSRPERPHRLPGSAPAISARPCRLATPQGSIHAAAPRCGPPRGTGRSPAGGADLPERRERGLARLQPRLDPLAISGLHQPRAVQAAHRLRRRPTRPCRAGPRRRAPPAWSAGSPDAGQFVTLQGDRVADLVVERRVVFPISSGMPSSRSSSLSARTSA